MILAVLETMYFFKCLEAVIELEI